ncbi:MAG: ribonuclease P protein component [Brevirhabdus sp.]
METLTKRVDFLAASRARRKVMPGFILQARQRRTEEPPAPLIRVGYTCSKKVGNAVARNKAKRRLREIARAHVPTHGYGGWDYVLVGRAGVTAGIPFVELCAQLQQALASIHHKSK